MHIEGLMLPLSFYATYTRAGSRQVLVVKRPRQPPMPFVITSFNVYCKTGQLQTSAIELSLSCEVRRCGQYKLGAVWDQDTLWPRPAPRSSIYAPEQSAFTAWP